MFSADPHQLGLAGAAPEIVRSPARGRGQLLIFVAGGLVAGIVCDATFESATAATVALAAVGAAAAVGALGGARLRLRLGVASLVALAAAAGMVRHSADVRRVGARHVARWVRGDRETLVRLRGVVAGPVRVMPAAPPQDYSFRREPRTRFDLQVETLQTADRWTPVEGLVGVSVPGRADWLLSDMRVELFGRLRRIRGPDNPGQFDWAEWNRRRGRLVSLSCASAENVVIVSNPPLGWASLRTSLRARLRSWLHAGSDANDDQGPATLLDAMLLGQRGAVERAVDQAFVKAGAVHFLSASGMHVAWLAAMVWAACHLVGLTHRPAALIAAAVVLVYAAVAEPNPPILRAAVTGCLWFAAQWLRRLPATMNWLAAAVCLLLFLRPSDLFDPGFQLSFVSIAALVLLLPRWLSPQPPHAAAPAGDPAALEALVPVSPWRTVLRDYVLPPVLASFIIWAVNVPLVCLHFGRLAVLGWLNCLLLAPLVFLVMLLGVVKLAASALVPSLGDACQPVLYGATRLLSACAGWLADIPGASIDVASVGWAAVAACWLIAFGPALISRHVPRRRVALLYPVPLLLAWTWPAIRGDGSDPGVRVWSLAVGAATVTIVQLPDTRAFAYDLGARPTYDVAESVILPFLRQRRIRRLEGVIVSHPDADHYGSVLSVADAVAVCRVWINPAFAPRAPPGTPAGNLLDGLRLRGIPVEVLRAGDRVPLGADTALEVLWPPDGDATLAWEDNDTSTVVRLTHAGQTVLLTGDVVDRAQAALLSRGDLRAGVLMLPHHGSARPPTLAEFIAAVDPVALVRSSDERDADTGERLWRAVGPLPCYNTADCGAVCVTLRSGGVEVRTFRPPPGRTAGAVYATTQRRDNNLRR